MTLNQVASEAKDFFNDGIAWVAVWKIWRSWEYEVFYPTGGSYEDGFTFSDSDYALLQRLRKEVNHVTMLNGYYTNCGADPEGVGGGLGTIRSIKDGIECNYYGFSNRLSAFIDDFIIPCDK